MASRLQQRSRMKNGKRQVLNENNRWTNVDDAQLVHNSGDDAAHFYDPTQDLTADSIEDEYADKTIKDLSASQVEAYIQSRFAIGSTVHLNGKDFKVTETAKPQSSDGGEGKTDVYVKLMDNAQNVEELKISIKKHNAEHWENKISTQRFEQIFQDHPEEGARILQSISNTIMNTRSPFDDIESSRQSVTLGFRLDALNKPRALSMQDGVSVPREVKRELLSGANLSEGKRNSLVNGEKVENSGVANYLLKLHADDSFLDGEDVVDCLVPIDEYADRDDCPIFFAAAAVNNSYSKSSQAFKEENRPILAHYELAAIDDNTLGYKLVVHKDLQTKSRDVRNSWTPEVEALLQRAREQKDVRFVDLPN